MSSKKKTTATKDDGKPALVPKLRFPEFQGKEEWKVKKLSTMVQLVSGMHLSPEQYGNEGEVPYFTGPSDFTNDVEGITKRTSDSASLANKEDTLITVKGSGVGELWYLTLPSVAMGRQLMAVRSIDAASRFVFQFLLTKRRRFADLAAGNLIPGLSRGDILDLEAPFPSPAEQQKLADCLSSVDEVIAAQARKVDALKTHKKGLMQQLFPREGETQPRLRFPEFRNAGEWVQKTVGDVSEVLMCKRIFAEETNPNQGVPFYKIGTLGGVPDAFISQEKFEHYKSRYNYPRTGEVLITCSGTIGKCLPFDGKDAYFQDSNIVWLDNSTGEVRNEFLLMLLSNVNWGKLNSTTITRIYGPDLRGLAIKYPEDEAEQERIATCLSSLDALITAESKKLEALKRHKRGLMQQLFPSPEAAEA